MKKKYNTLIFIIIAIALLYIAKNKYSTFNVNKSIQACMLAQKKIGKDKEMTREEIEKICEEHVKSQIK